jgi:hypothetical protein
MEHKTNLEINKHYKFDWCIIEGNNTVVCYNADKSHNIHWLTDKAALINTEIWIDELGLLHIESENKIVPEFSYDKTPIEKLEHTPSNKCIKHYNGIKWFGIKPYDYVYGWWYYKSDIHANYILSNYTLKIK